jgi:peptidoglycan/LPS O-acetylase OafA/YrhL
VPDSDDAPRRLGRRPALDGIRGIAWAIVFFSHALTLPVASGQVAMFVFFALSGFLITGLLVEERAGTGRVSLPNFFARRALRLLPALAFFLIGWLVVVLVTAGHDSWTTTVPGGEAGTGTSPLVALQGAAAALFYVSNWASVGHWFTGYVPLGHLWSLAVEEQFYLLWSPVVVLLLARWHRAAVGRAAVGWAAGLAAAASFADVALRGGQGVTLAIDMGTDTRAGAFLVGAGLAIAWARRAPWLDAVGVVGRRTVVGASLLTLAWGAWVFDHSVSAAEFAATWIAVSLAAGLLVISFVLDPEQEDRTRPGVVASPLATYVGRRSYGLYLWHYAWLTWLAGMGLAGVPLALGASFATAEASWRLVERPALARKQRFTVSRASAVPAVPAPGPELTPGFPVEHARQPVAV